MDAGSILAQSKLDIDPFETVGELHDRLAADGAPLVARVVDELSSGRATETPQDESASTIAPKLSRDDSKLDFTRPALDIANQIRGMYPWPGCRVNVGEKIVTLVRARALPEISSTPPGTITPEGHIACGEGALDILELQPQGKRPMSLTAFRNGHPWLAGTTVTSVT
jgi:methionyl-tRNA formyltransferase